MFIVKAIGSVAVLSSAVLWNTAQKKKDDARLCRLEAQVAFVRFVRDKIDRYLAPITEILRDCDTDVLRDICIGCESAECMDVEALRVLLRSGEYYADGGEIMDSFLLSLGSSYREGEIAGCDICLRELNAVYEKLKKELPSERKGRGVLFSALRRE